MPNYNHASYLPNAIDSVLAQSRLPDEFLILDDASTDNSVPIIESYASAHSFIRLIRGEQNVGVNAAHRRLFEEAKCDFIDPMAADDSRYPRCYELAMEMAQRWPDVGIIFGQMVIVSESGGELSTLGATAWREAIHATPEQFRVEYLEAEPPSQALTAATLLRREPFQAVGWYCDGLGSWGDTFAANAVALKHGACYVPEPFARWRKAAGSFSQSTTVDPRATLDMINRAARMMRTPQFCECFPDSYVRRWKRQYVWRTIKEYWRCDNTDEIPPGASLWGRYRHRLPRTFEALSLFWHRTDLSNVSA